MSCIPSDIVNNGVILELNSRWPITAAIVGSGQAKYLEITLAIGIINTLLRMMDVVLQEMYTLE